MERYDFSQSIDLIGSIPGALDHLTNKEMLAAHEAIIKIKEESESNAIAEHMEWFDTAILPCLKRFAEASFSILDVERDRDSIIQAAIRNSSCIEFSTDSRYLYAAISSAATIGIEVEDGDAVLVLTYDCEKFMI